MKLIESIASFAPEFRALRQEIHAYPELSFKEVRTSDLIAQKLSGWGIPIVRGLAQTGLVGSISAGSSARSVGIRADMDALPLQERNTFAHRSRNDGRMHACGHDGHVATLLAAARYLAETKNFDGTVHLIFQPAEEGGGGAREMIREGLFERFPCDAVFAMHNWPGSKVGSFEIAHGAMMASSNEFEITITGKGAHAAMPHNGIDPVLTAVALAQNLQSLITRNKKPLDTAVLSITQIHAGDAYNVIPDQALLRGTVRTFSTQVLDSIEEGMNRIVDHTARTFGAEATLCFTRNYPPTINHSEELAFAANIMREVVGAENVRTDGEPTMGAEDFAFMLLEKPGCYFFIGNGNGEHMPAGHGGGPCMLHSPGYDFNDDLIPIGATLWVRLVEAYLGPAPPSGI